MPAHRSPSRGRAAQHDAEPLPAPTQEPEAAAELTVDETVTDSAATTGDAEDVPMNRAARRAKGKAAMQPRPVGKILPGRTNQSHGPRSYANRRSG